MALGSAGVAVLRGRRISVMIIDDSNAARRVFERMLETEPQIEVIASVGDAEEALRQIPVLRPAIITLDVVMPGLGGIEALKEILEILPGAKVIMLSTLTQVGSPTSREALERGAAAVLAKPGLGVSAAHFKHAFCAKVLELMHKAS